MAFERRNLIWIGMRLYVRKSSRQLAELFRDRHDRTLFCFRTSDGFLSEWMDLDRAKIEAMAHAVDLMNKKPNRTTE